VQNGTPPLARLSELKNRHETRRPGEKRKTEKERCRPEGTALHERQKARNGPWSLFCLVDDFAGADGVADFGEGGGVEGGIGGEDDEVGVRAGGDAAAVG